MRRSNPRIPLAVALARAVAIAVTLVAPRLARSAPHPVTDVPTSIPAMFRSSVAWGDVDRDGDLDLLVTGLASGGDVSRIYRNDGGTFVDLGAGLMPAETGSGDWIDFDSDGDLDVFVCGTFNDPPSRLYRNDGGIFVDAGAAIPAYYQASTDWGDLDNDGDPDLIIAGSRTGGDDAANLFRNDGAGVFTERPLPVPGFRRGSLDLGDYDRDGDLDLVVTGIRSLPLSDVYRNDGGLTFTPLAAGLMSLYDGRAAWGDADADGDLDILSCGSDHTGSHVFTRLYRNTGAGFVDAAMGLTGAGEGADFAWGDFDDDGDLDYAAIAVNFGGSALFRNDGATFIDPGTNLRDVCCGALAWGDYDGDLDLDLALNGLPDASKLYRNDAPVANTPPSSPSGLSAIVTGDDVVLSWLAGSDAQTPSPALSYNLRVGRSSGAGDVLSAMSESTGRRLVPDFGNVGPNLSWPLRGLADGAYFWSVQSVDAAFVGSAFAAEGSFTIVATVSVGEPTAATADLRITRPLPNPIAAPGTLVFELARAQSVVIEVFDSSGRRIAELANGALAAGRHQVTWDPRGASPGLYWYRVSGGGASVTNRTIVMGRDAGR